jgi:hypothetical protein
MRSRVRGFYSNMWESRGLLFLKTFLRSSLIFIYLFFFCFVQGHSRLLIFKLPYRTIITEQQ